MDKKIIENNFRKILEENGITLNELCQILQKVSRKTVEGIWYGTGGRQANNVYYHAVDYYGKLHKKGWKI